jgi:hypothetical protein
LITDTLQEQCCVKIKAEIWVMYYLLAMECEPSPAPPEDRERPETAYYSSQKG